MMKQTLLLYVSTLLFSTIVLGAQSCLNVFSQDNITESVIKNSISHSNQYLDERNKKWADEQKCLCCHTTLPYVLSRAFDSQSSQNFKKFEVVAREGTENPSRRPWYTSDHAGVNSYPTESVLNAITLIMYDRKQTDPKLRPVTLKSIERIFENLDQSGGLHWLDFDLQPFESKQGELWGNSMAILAIEMAEKYSNYRAPQDKYRQLKKLLINQRTSLNLNEKSVLIWAHSMNDKILSPELLAQFANDIANSQKSTGAWNQKSFIPDGRMEEDAYATSMGLLALVKSKSHPEAARKAAAWLLTKQRTSEQFGLQEPRNFWVTTSMNRDRNLNNLFSSDAATGFATLALKAYMDER